MATTDKPGDLHIYGRLLSYVVPYWAAFLLSIVGFVLYSAANVGFVQLIGYIVDSLGGNDPLAGSGIANQIQSVVGDGQELNRTVIPILIVSIVFMRGVGTFIGNYFITYIGTNLVHNLRVELFDRLLMLPSKFYDKNAMGHLVAKVTFHVTQVTGAATDAVRVLVREGLTVLGYLGFLFFLNWKLTFIFIAVAPFIALLVTFAGKRFRRISERIQDSMGDVTHVASEAVQGYREVRTFGGMEYERDRFLKVSHNNRQQSMKMVITSSIATPTVQLVVSFALAGLVWLALDPTLLSNMSSGDVVAFITTGGLLAKPIRQLSEINATVQRGLAAAEDIFDLFDEEVESDQGTKELTGVKGKLEFRNVSFAYQDNEYVLKDVSFRAEPGETIALVGKSGSGKSTLASLIPRFYAQTEGEILLDDIPIQDLTLANLRSHMAIVSQDVTLFNDTVARNIAYGSLFSKDQNKIREAAEKAYAWGFIEKLENGLETIVGDDGVLLSGGQRQRLAIARAFLKDAPILILDEATSALDSESERYIQSALEAVSAGRTTIVIAHRLSTIEKADRILVVDDGQLVEQGSHAELLAKGEHYAALHNLQHEDSGQVSPAQLEPEFTPVKVATDNKLKWLSREVNPLVTGWYQEASWLNLLRPVAWVFTRLADYRRQNTEAWQAPVPVIVVGNINVGGTGKTPLVAWLTEQLVAQGHKPGIVSRGYGGTSSRYPLLVNPQSDAIEAGDEAVLLARKTGCPVVVDPDRSAAAQYLLDEEDCNVIISDDGLQHYALGRDAEIAVIDGERGLGNGFCLPAGPLREPPSRLQEVDVVIVNGDHQLELGVPHMNMRVMVNSIEPLAENGGLDAPNSQTVHGVAGIGNPDRFFETLREMGYEVMEHRFDDHHRFELADLDFGDSLPVIMTEKDAVKCRQLLIEQIHGNFWYLDITVQPDERLLAKLLSKLGLNIRQLNPARTV
jgi:subfamily B ATP-binding cassette protein MsbA